MRIRGLKLHVPTRSRLRIRMGRSGLASGGVFSAARNRADMVRKYKAKICKSCGEEFVPRSGVQMICDDCRAKEADRPRRAPTAAMLREYNRRQKETIRKLQEEVATMKAKALAPQSALFAEINTLKKAIEQQREMIGEGQRSVVAMGHRNHELRKGIAATIEALQGILKEDGR